MGTNEGGRVRFIGNDVSANIFNDIEITAGSSTDGQAGNILIDGSISGNEDGGTNGDVEFYGEMYLYAVDFVHIQEDFNTHRLHIFSTFHGNNQNLVLLILI